MFLSLLLLLFVDGHDVDAPCVLQRFHCVLLLLLRSSCCCCRFVGVIVVFAVVDLCAAKRFLCASCVQRSRDDAIEQLRRDLVSGRLLRIAVCFYTCCVLLLLLLLLRFVLLLLLLLLHTHTLARTRTHPRTRYTCYCVVCLFYCFTQTHKRTNAKKLTCAQTQNNSHAHKQTHIPPARTNAH